ncbi:MAG: cobalamin biosynthesis protein CobN [Methanobacterium sp.]|nr:MAG: cobalamin biosynthesis protein CobN [Methanobacterium sp.]
MRKQAILLVITIVFILALCGAVYAEDSQGGAETPLEGDSEMISYSTTSNPMNEATINLNINLEHPEALAGDKLPTITLEDTDGNSYSLTSVIKIDNQKYQINFNSDKTSVILNISAPGHVAQMVNVNLSKLNPQDSKLQGEANVNLKAYNLLIISSSDSYSKAFAESYKQLRNQGYYYNLHYFSLSQLSSDDAETQQRLEQAAIKADLIAIQMVSSPDSVARIKSLIEKSNAMEILAIRCGVGFVDDPRFNSDDTITREYWAQGAQENIRRFQLYILNSIGMELKDAEDLSVVEWPNQWIYHPDSPVPTFQTWQEYYNWYQNHESYQADAPWVGIVAYDSSFKGDNQEMHIALLRSLESKGVNVILTFSNAQGRINIMDLYFKNGNQSRIDAFITCVGFNYVTGVTKGVELFQDLNVPVFAPVYSSNLQEWLDNSYGLVSELHWQIAQPEIDGRIEPILMGGKENAEVDHETGILVIRFTPLEDRIERITSRVVNWVKLRNMDNMDKQIALLYYNIGGGKDGVSASYLDVVASLENILKALKEDGYHIPVDYSAEDIVDLMLNAGNNVGSWAPGELEKVVQAGAITIPISDYLAWFETLPLELQKEVLAQWGPAPGNVMIYDNQIVIPGIMLGNVFLGPQPMRGWGEDPEKIRHSNTLVPHHQYIAFYMWLQNHFDAVIHLGTHGTLEWLPGRSVGLGEDDWPDALLGNLPNIYPYIVENPGEGTQAKRRGYAVIIDHMIPPMIPSELYGDLADLNDLISSYHTSLDPQRKEVLQYQIMEMILKLHIHVDLKIDMENDSFQDIVHEVEHYLEDLAEEMMPYGLHIFGAPISGDLLDEMIESIVSFHPEERDNPEYREMLRKNLSHNYEIQNLLAALRAEFISPAPSGSPIRKPDVLPTGYNFYSFDPRTAPDSAAWELGKKMADDLVNSFCQEKGYYPDNVGVVLWSIESMRTNGQSIALILRLMGLEPVWSSGRLNGFKVTPLEELGRPRIDVTVSISGLFRDTFSYTIDMLDDAFRLVASLDENGEENHIRKNYLEDREKFLNLGLSPAEAENLAIARIFGPAPKAYGTGLSELTTTTTGWEDQSDLVDTYLNRMSYYYGRNQFAVSGLEAFKNQLTRIDATVQVRDGLYGVLDNDDVVQYLGGLTMAAQSLSGKEVNIYIANSRTLNVKIESLSTFLNTELRTRVFNPKWAEGLLKNGFSGANTINKHVENLFRWHSISPESVEDWMWDTVAEYFILNGDMRNQLIEANPHAFKSIAAWTLEVARRDMWNGDASMVSVIADIYIQSNLEYGVTCCHHTCANMAFNQYVMSSSSLSQNALQQFANIMESATGMKLSLPGVTNPSNPESPSNPTNPSTPSNPNSGSTGEVSDYRDASEASDVEVEMQQDSDESVGTENQKAYEVEEAHAASSAQSGVPIAAIVGVVLLLTLVAAGYFKNDLWRILKK